MKIKGLLLLLAFFTQTALLPKSIIRKVTNQVTNDKVRVLQKEGAYDKFIVWPGQTKEWNFELSSNLLCFRAYGDGTLGSAYGVHDRKDIHMWDEKNGLVKWTINGKTDSFQKKQKKNFWGKKYYSKGINVILHNGCKIEVEDA